MRPSQGGYPGGLAGRRRSRRGRGAQRGRRRTRPDQGRGARWRPAYRRSGFCRVVRGGWRGSGAGDTGRPAETARQGACRSSGARAGTRARVRFAHGTAGARTRFRGRTSLMSRVELLEPRAAYALWAASYPPRAHNPVMHAEERAMLALMPTDLHGQSVLDAGCGSGRYMLHALSRGAVGVTGVDLSIEMLERAGKELGARGHLGDIELAQGNLERLPVPDASADLTICGLTIGHLDRLQPGLSELCRVTRPGGTILCSDVHPIGHALGWLRDFKTEEIGRAHV